MTLSRSDETFLASLHAGAEPDEALRQFDRVLQRIGLCLEKLKAIPLPVEPFQLGFSCAPLGPNDGLKDVLATEKRICEKVCVHGDQGHVALAQALNLWSRPLASGGGETSDPFIWSVTPRFRRAFEGIAGTPQPGPIFYVNTDMYEFGTGLDIRESPKHLKENITPIMVDRLQLVTCHQLPADGRNLSDEFKDGENGYLICEAQLREEWSKIFVEYHGFVHGFLTCEDPRHDGGGDSRQLRWEFKIGKETNSAFLSSGENQALFVLAMLHGVVTDGSCLLLDEPELHLTFRAGSKLMRRILERARATESQAIIVTHLPHLYRSVITADRDPWRKGAEYDYGRLRMIHVGDETGPLVTYDRRAVDAAARYAHADVIELVDGLHVDEVKIWPPREEWRAWRKIFQRRKKAGGTSSSTGRSPRGAAPS